MTSLWCLYCKHELFKRQLHKMVKPTQTIRRQHPNCLDVFDHFVVLALKGFNKFHTQLLTLNRYLLAGKLTFVEIKILIKF